MACEHGKQLNKDNICEICPQGTYRTVHVDLSCISCQVNRTTIGEGATSQADCTRGNVNLFSGLIHEIIFDQVTVGYFLVCLPTSVVQLSELTHNSLPKVQYNDSNDLADGLLLE